MMSACEEQSQNSSEEEEGEIKDNSLSDTEPVTVHEDSPEDVSSSPAFQHLDELFTSGKISGTRVSKLKAKYTLLYETLKTSQKSEKQLLQDAKRFTSELEKQKLDKADNFPEGSNTEVSKLRQQLLKYNDDLKLTEEREYHLQYKLDCLLEEKRLLEEEYQRIPKAGKLAKPIKLLKERSEELQKENTQRRLEVKALKEDVQAKQRKIKKDQTELEKHLQQQQFLKEELQTYHVPEQLCKDIEIILQKITATEKEKVQLEEECRDLQNNLKEVKHTTKETIEKKEATAREIEKKHILLGNKEKELNNLTKLLEISKEDEVMALGERAALDLNLCHTLAEIQIQHDNLTRQNREKERELSNIKNAKFKLKSASEALAETQTTYDMMKTVKNKLLEENCKLLERRNDLHREVENIRRHLEEQQLISKQEVCNMQKYIAEEEKLLKEQDEHRKQLINLTRLVPIKANEKQEKYGARIKAQQSLNEILQEIKARDLTIRENKNKLQAIQKSLKSYAKLNAIVHSEANKYVRPLQMSALQAAELREKIKILENEVETLKTNKVNKNSQLQEARSNLNNSHLIRNSIANEVSSVRQFLQEIKEKKEKQMMEIERLTNIINQMEKDMVQLRKKYKTAVRNRNERAVQLNKREEEVRICHEKINIQETLLRKRDTEIKALDEKIHILQLKINKHLSEIKQAEKRLPHKRALESELVTLQIQLSQCKDRMRELENKVDKTKSKNRIHLLRGKDPSLQALMKKSEELKFRLAKKEECLMENDFLHEQLIQRSENQNKAEEDCKQDTQNLARKMFDLRATIKDTNRKMMALIAEVSMQQANCIKFQHEAKDKGRFVETCYKRLDQGLPPCKAMEQEWKRTLRDQNRRILEKEQKAKISEAEKQHLLPNGVHTTAEKRPNAYIPDAERVLPLPRPYGSLAPFKPSELGFNIRRIKGQL